MRCRDLTCPFLLAAALTVVTGGGCSGSSGLRARTGLPWPDEWAVGQRPPTDYPVTLDERTRGWHQRAQWTSVIREIDALLTPMPQVYHFRRIGVFASEGPRGIRPTGLKYIEVHMAPTFLPTSSVPDKVAVECREQPLTDVLTDLCGRLGRGYLLGPEVDASTAVTCKMEEADPRIALVNVLLAHDLFIEPVWYAPVVLRSFEYPSRGEFLEAIRFAAKGMHPPPDGTTLVIVPFDRWVEKNLDTELRMRAAQRRQWPKGRTANPPGRDLEAVIPLAKRQVLYAMPFAIKGD